MRSFSGLYFLGESWNLDVEDVTLKQSLLFFDKIYAIIPELFSVDWKSVQPSEELPPHLVRARCSQENEFARIKEYINSGEWPPDRREPYLPEIARYTRITRFLDEVKLLRYEKALELVDPQQNLLDSLEDLGSDILSGSVLNDLRDEVFRTTAVKQGSESMVLYKGEIEQDWLARLGESSGFLEDEWQWLPASGSFCGDLVGAVSRPMWAAFIINQTLIAAYRHSLIPVTASGTFNELLQSKIRRIQSQPMNKQLCFPLTITLPNPQIISFEGILELRLALKDELSALREHMALLTERIKEEQWTPGLESEIQHIIKHDIEPAVQEFQRRLTNSTNQAARHVLASSVPAAIPLLVNIWAGFPPLLVMALSAGNINSNAAQEYHKQAAGVNGISIFLQHQ